MCDPENFLNYFCQKNTNFIQGAQCCSQDFIRTLIRNVNSEFLKENDNSNIVYDNLKSCLQGNECIEYEKFIKQNNLYKESKIQSLFSGITKSYSSGTCKFCYKNIENISFNFFIGINIYHIIVNPLASIMEEDSVFTSPYLSAGAPVLGEAKG